MVTRNRARPIFKLCAGASLVCVSVLIGGCSVSENPYESQTVHGDEAVELIQKHRIVVTEEQVEQLARELVALQGLDPTSMEGKEGQQEDEEEEVGDSAPAPTERCTLAQPGLWPLLTRPEASFTAQRASRPRLRAGRRRRPGRRRAPRPMR